MVPIFRTPIYSSSSIGIGSILLCKIADNKLPPLAHMRARGGTLVLLRWWWIGTCCTYWPRTSWTAKLKRSPHPISKTNDKKRKHRAMENVLNCAVCAWTSAIASYRRDFFSLWPQLWVGWLCRSMIVWTTSIGDFNWIELYFSEAGALSPRGHPSVPMCGPYIFFLSLAFLPQALAHSDMGTLCI